MSSSDLIRADFFGRPVSLSIIDGGEWLAADTCAPLLELADGAKVRQLYTRHKGEFIDGVEYRYLTLDSAPSRPTLSGPPPTARRVLVFSLDGLEHLALLTRSTAGVRLRRWCIDTRRALREGAARIVTTAQVDLLRAQVEKTNAALVEAHAEHARQIREMFGRLCLSNERMASAFGSGLAERGRQKRHERALQAELDIGQKFFPGIDDRRDGDLNGPALTGGRN